MTGRQDPSTRPSRSRDAEEVLRATLAAAPPAVFVVDWEGRIRGGWNGSATTLLGWSAAEARGQVASGLLGLRTSDGKPLEVAPPRDGSIRGPVAALVQNRGGRDVPVDVTMAPFENQLGQTAGGVVFLQDRSYLRTLEAQLRQAQKLEAVGQLAGGIAHDFNNLLTIVQTNTELLGDLLAEPGQGARHAAIEEHLADIGDAVARGSELVRRLMSFGRNEPGRTMSLDLGELLSGYARTLQRILPDDVTVEVKVGAAVPRVRVDPGAVQQVVLNLATNARDAMPNGGVLRLAVTSERNIDGPPTGVRLSVADTGIGIEPDVLKHVFEPFFTTKDPERGTGLGLSMVRELVRQMDGSIEAESVLGEGTEFIIRLPAGGGSGDLVPEVEKPSGRPAQAGAGTILIVEDDASVRKVIRRALAAAGYEVIVTADGEQALEAFNRHPEAVDLIVSDLIMPNMDGASLHSALQGREGPPVPFLFISGYGDRDPRMEDLMARGVPVLHKPWSVAALCEAVQDALIVSSDSKEVDSGSFRNP